MYLMHVMCLMRLMCLMGLFQEGPVVVVVDRFNDRLLLWRLGDGTVWKQLGSEGKEPGQFYYPKAVAVTRSGALVVTDNRRVQVLTVDGAILCVLDPTRRLVVGMGQLGEYLSGVAVCDDTAEILVTDYDNNRLIALTWSGPSHVRLFYVFEKYLLLLCLCVLIDVVLSHDETGCVGVQGVAGQLEGVRAWGRRGVALGQLNGPWGVVAMSAGSVWVVDFSNHRLCLLR
jgi:DNA-binding beta-propeller fold protein YncE